MDGITGKMDAYISKTISRTVKDFLKVQSYFNDVSEHEDKAEITVEQVL